MTINISRRTALIAMGTSTLTTPLLAQKAGDSAGDPLTVELNGIALPVVRNGVLTNYLFGLIVIQLGDSGSVFFLREHSYLLRDAIVKIASRSPIPEGATPKSFDRVAVTRIVIRALQAVRPSARIVRVTVQDAAFMRN